jgi:pyruvate-ferredoxin/flavodoxin oxidoreductase
VAERRFVTLDGNEATANIAHLCNEVMAIYPITPSSGLGELPDAWAAAGRKNIFGTVPHVVEMQSEAGAAGAAHGSMQAGALTSTFTASQGLLLMIPNMFKIAGELTSTVFHVTARTVATHALSIFGDHSDVMAVRSTGWALLSAASVQESQDMAMISQAATLAARLPFLHFYDGFRISHEVNKIEQISEDDVRAMTDMELVAEHRARALNPEKPVLRGTAQNPDHFFQAREACNPFYDRCAGIVQQTMDRFAKLTGRQYHLFDYYGPADADRVIITMGSSCGVVEETVDKLAAEGQKIGFVAVRLYRPFDAKAFIACLPKGVKKIAVLDRTKEPGALGEPLYLDVVAALSECWGEYSSSPMPKVVAGRYGLSSKEFTPAMVAAIYAELSKAKPKQHFTIGINDDVTHLSLEYDEHFSAEGDDVTRAVFYGLGSDGTVSANRSSVKIVGENTPWYSQGYFVYDSRKAGSVTTSHVRFSPRPIKGSYLVHRANFVACHQFHFLERIDMLKVAEPGATFLLNSPFGPDEVWDNLPREVQEQIVSKKLKFYVVDGYKVARDTNMGVRINTIMQTCFFKLAKILPPEQAIAEIKAMIKSSYGKKGGEKIIQQNYAAVDGALASLAEVKVPAAVSSKLRMVEPMPAEAPEFVREVEGMIIANRGDEIRVGAFPVDGTFPTGTTKYEKRSIAQQIPIWDAKLCIQCGQCSLVCPHATLRMKVYDASYANGKAPQGFIAVEAKGKEFPGKMFTLQVFPDDCTGCGVCVDVCPAKDKAEPKHKAINMEPKTPHLERERKALDHFLTIPDVDRTTAKQDTIKGSQFLLPLFEFSGACAGCGETPYVKLITQFFGDRMMIANATGCSSIYGGNTPCTPYTVDANGHGPTWSNSLFEDAAEFGMGFRLAVDQQIEYASSLLGRLAPKLGDELVSALLANQQEDDAQIAKQRALVADLRKRLASLGDADAKALAASADFLIRKSVWSFGGDGWAYDIGFGGLDHVLASGRDVNILVLDTEVYSNTGGQASKATPRGAVAKFAAAGKPGRKKDLGLIAMSYGNVFVGQIALGANPLHAIKTIRAAEAYRGPSIVIAFSHCIGWGIDMTRGMDYQKEAVACGYWPLFHYDPRDKEQPFHLDSRAPTGIYKEFAMKQARFAMLARSKPEVAERLAVLGQEDISTRWALYEQLTGATKAANGGHAAASTTKEVVE